MKTCLFITGTNGVGKTSVARALIARHGGIAYEENQVTFLKRDGVCLAGPYAKPRRGGVDALKNERGVSCTSELENCVRHGLETCDAIICEGSYLDTFGLNLLRAIFAAERQIVVALYAQPELLNTRLNLRSPGHLRDFKKVVARQVRVLRAAEKWSSIGVEVHYFDTGQIDSGSIADEIDKMLSI